MRRILLVLLLVACHSTPRPSVPPNPDGSPWGPPPVPDAALWVQTELGPVVIIHQGYQIQPEVVLKRLMEAAKVCPHGPAAYAYLRVKIMQSIMPNRNSPTGYAGGEWDAAKREIRVVGYYLSYNGDVTKYSDSGLIDHEAKHVLGCI